MAQVYLTKSITASSSNTLGIYSSATTTAYTSGATYTIGSGATLDSARRLIFWSSVVDMSGLRITVTGKNETGITTISETIVGSTTAASPRATTQDFLTLDSVVFSSQNPINGPIHVGTNTQGGTPWKVTDTYSQAANPFSLSVALSFNSTISTTIANFEATLDDVTQTIPGGTRTLSTNPATIVPFTPTVFIPQTAGSTTISSAAASGGTVTGYLNSPQIAAWRLTLTSSSSTAGGVFATAIQGGV